MGDSALRRLPPALGLRAQILLALSGVLAVSFALLGLATVQLTRSAQTKTLEAEQRQLARLIANLFEAAPAQAKRDWEAALDAGLAGSDVVALRVARQGNAAYERGDPPDLAPVRVPLQDGQLELWFRRSSMADTGPLTSLLTFYVAFTAAAVLLLMYLALTHTIVRPLDRLTRAAERLSDGRAVDVPDRGAVEVTRLGTTFRRMAAELRAERQTLEARLAELERTTLELQSTERQLVHSEKLASVGRLAAGIAHEVGNPLSAILGLVELLEAGDVPEAEAKEFLQRIHAETERIHGIIRDLLDYSRQGADTDLRGTSCDLAEAIEDAVSLVRPLKELRRIDIQVQVPPGLPPVIGAGHRLTQVVLNLLLNAAEALNEHLREGRGHIRITATAGDESRGVTLDVSDDGPGIAAEIFETLFDPFTTTKPVGKGTGLGLAVCHAVIDALGGSLQAENLPDGGARFRAHLPVARLSSRPPTSTGTPAARHPFGDLPGEPEAGGVPGGAPGGSGSVD